MYYGENCHFACKNKKKTKYFYLYTWDKEQEKYIEIGEIE